MSLRLLRLLNTIDRPGSAGTLDGSTLRQPFGENSRPDGSPCASSAFFTRVNGSFSSADDSKSARRTLNVLSFAAGGSSTSFLPS